MHFPYQICVLKELNGWRVRYDHKRNPVIIMRSLRVSVDRIVKYEPSIWPRSPWVLRSSVDRAPPRCSGGHRFPFCRGLRFFSLSHAHDMLIISSTQDKHINPRIKHTDLAICYTSRVFMCPSLFCPFRAMFIRRWSVYKEQWGRDYRRRFVIVMIVTIIVMYCVLDLVLCLFVLYSL